MSLLAVDGEYCAVDKHHGPYPQLRHARLPPPVGQSLAKWPTAGCERHNQEPQHAKTYLRCTSCIRLLRPIGARYIRLLYDPIACVYMRSLYELSNLIVRVLTCSFGKRNDPHEPVCSRELDGRLLRISHISLKASRSHSPLECMPWTYVPFLEVDGLSMTVQSNPLGDLPLQRRHLGIPRS